MRLTVAPGHRHPGTSASGVILDNTGTAAPAIDVLDDHVTIEWLVIRNGDALQHGVRLTSLAGAGANQVIVRGLVLDYIPGAAIAVQDVDARADIYNNIVDSPGQQGIALPTLNAGTSRIRIWNNSIYNSVGDGIASAANPNPTVTLVNNIVTDAGAPNQDYDVATPGTASNNTDEDGTAPAAGRITTTAALVWQAPGTNFHLRTGANTQRDAGLTVSALGVDVDGQARPAGPAWDRGADELGAATVNHRSIGTAADYTAGTITVVQGSDLVTGTGTTWLAYNRGRGDRIFINSVNYVVLRVISDTLLRLTVPYAGVTASYSNPNYLVARQFKLSTGPQDWFDCVDGSGSCAPFATPASGNLVTQNRSEVGIVHEEALYIPVSCGDSVVEIDGATTDAQHTITLTADGVNRHDGTSGTNARFGHAPGCDSGDMSRWATAG